MDNARRETIYSDQRPTAWYFSHRQERRLRKHDKRVQFAEEIAARREVKRLSTVLRALTGRK